MEYLNIKLETVGDIRYVGSKPLVRATWLNLLIYCVKQENSGRISNCRAWGNDTWAQIAGLKKAEVHAASALWTWEGDDLVVWAYPLHNEKVCAMRRAVGRQGGKASGASRRSSNPEAIAEPIASADAEANLEQKGKGMEDNEKGEYAREADGIAELYCRQDSPLEVRACLIDDMNTGTPAADIRTKVQQCMQFIRQAPGGSGNRFVPRALTFFEYRQWRSPEAFQERWKTESRSGKTPVKLSTQPKGGW